MKKKGYVWQSSVTGKRFHKGDRKERGDEKSMSGKNRMGREWVECGWFLGEEKTFGEEGEFRKNATSSRIVLQLD